MSQVSTLIFQQILRPTLCTWTPPLAARQTEISLEGPEAITDEELEAAFAELEQRNSTDA